MPVFEGLLKSVKLCEMQSFLTLRLSSQRPSLSYELSAKTYSPFNVGLGLSAGPWAVGIHTCVHSLAGALALHGCLEHFQAFSLEAYKKHPAKNNTFLTTCVRSKRVESLCLTLERD